MCWMKKTPKRRTPERDEEDDEHADADEEEDEHTDPEAEEDKHADCQEAEVEEVVLQDVAEVAGVVLANGGPY